MSTLLGFELVNEDKYDRAIHGEIKKTSGELEGGVGDVSDKEKLAAYDKLAGLIKKNGYKVKTGTFYDFKAKKIIENPKIVYVLPSTEGSVEVPEGEEFPLEVKAQQIIEKKKLGRPRKEKKEDDKDSE